MPCVHDWFAVDISEADYALLFECADCGSAARVQLVKRGSDVSVQTAVLTPGPLVSLEDLRALAYEVAATCGLSGPAVERVGYGAAGSVSNRATRRAGKAGKHRNVVKAV